MTANWDQAPFEMEYRETTEWTVGLVGLDELKRWQRIAILIWAVTLLAAIPGAVFNVTAIVWIAIVALALPVVAIMAVLLPLAWRWAWSGSVK